MKKKSKGKRITKKFEANLPVFRSHEEAREYFKAEFGNDFVLHEPRHSYDEKIFIYHLILDRVSYEKGIKKFQERKWSLADNDCYNFLFSYQPVQIDEDGNVYI